MVNPKGLTFRKFWAMILNELTLRIRNMIAIRKRENHLFMDDRWFYLFSAIFSYFEIFSGAGVSGFGWRGGFGPKN